MIGNQLSAKQMLAIQHLIYDKMSITDTAKALEMSRNGIYDLFENSEWLAEYNKQLDKIQSEASNRAMAKIIELLNNENPKIALAASKDILDRAGRQAVQKQEIVNSEMVINIVKGE